MTCYPNLDNVWKYGTLFMEMHLKGSADNWKYKDLFPHAVWQGGWWIWTGWMDKWMIGGLSTSMLAQGAKGCSGNLSLNLMERHRWPSRAIETIWSNSTRDTSSILWTIDIVTHSMFFSTTQLTLNCKLRLYNQTPPVYCFHFLHMLQTKLGCQVNNVASRG